MLSLKEDSRYDRVPQSRPADSSLEFRGLDLVRGASGACQSNGRLEQVEEVNASTAPIYIYKRNVDFCKPARKWRSLNFSWTV